MTLRPSSLQRAELCPGSAMMEAMTENPKIDTPDADRGADFHEVVRQFLIGKDPSDIEGFDDYADQIVWAVEKADTVIANARIPIEAIRLIERRVNLSKYGLAEKYGTVDEALVVEFDRGVVLDWKSGYNPQPKARNNRQLMCYAVGIADAFQLNEVTVALIEAGIRQVSVHTYDDAGLDAARLKITQIVADAKRFDAPLIPGPRQCHYCAAAHRCEALKTSFDATSNYKNLTGGMATEILDAADMAHMWASNVKQYFNAVGFAKLAAGEEIDFGDYYMKKGRDGNRKWKDGITKTEVLDAIDAVKPGASGEVEILDHKLKTPTRIVELLKALGAKAKEADNALNGIVERKPGGHVLARKPYDEGVTNES